MSDSPDTIKILDEMRKELQRAQEEYAQKPDYEKLKEIRFLEHKVNQYSARAEQRQS